MTKSVSKIATEIEESHDRVLTQRQRSFAQYFVEGLYSNAECARKAGYSEKVSWKQASVLLNGRDFPHVVEYIQELREERERKYGVTVLGQMKRLHDLSRGAEDANQFSAAINAEKLRSSLGGLVTDRREQLNVMDSMSREEILNKLDKLKKQYPQAFEGEYKIVEDES